MTVLVEADRMHVDPARARCPQLHPHRQPIRLGRIAQLAEGRPAALEVLRVDGQIEIAVLPGLPSSQSGDAPAAGGSEGDVQERNPGPVSTPATQPRARPRPPP
jgi:hypothetical protein